MSCMLPARRPLHISHAWQPLANRRAVERDLDWDPAVQRKGPLTAPGRSPPPPPPPPPGRQKSGWVRASTSVLRQQGMEEVHRG